MTSPETLPDDIAVLRTALTAERVALQQAEARASGAEAMVTRGKRLVVLVWQRKQWRSPLRVTNRGNGGRESGRYYRPVPQPSGKEIEPQSAVALLQ